MRALTILHRHNAIHRGSSDHCVPSQGVIQRINEGYDDNLLTRTNHREPPRALTTLCRANAIHRGPSRALATGNAVPLPRLKAIQKRAGEGPNHADPPKALLRGPARVLTTLYCYWESE